MPVMAWVVIRARPTPLISQLHMIYNYALELDDRQEMWMAHFTATCDMVCRVSPADPSSGTASQMEQSVWTPPEGIPPEGITAQARHQPAAAAAPRAWMLARRRASSHAPSSSTPASGHQLSTTPPPRREPAADVPAARGSSTREPLAAEELWEESALGAVLSGRVEDDSLMLTLSRLADMGFTDESLNRDVLAAVNQDEERAVAWLCDLASSMAPAGDRLADDPP